MSTIIKKIKEQNNYDFSRFNDNQIANVAHMILEDFKVDSYPVPIVAIAEKLGFEIYGINIKSEVSGIIIIDVDLINNYGTETDKAIFINTNDNPGHRRFALAHELGHYIFDFNETKDTRFYNAYLTTEKYGERAEEKRVNKFAAELLMPKEEFKEVYNSLKEKNDTIFEIVNTLTKYFAVSRTAIERRIVELKL